MLYFCAIFGPLNGCLSILSRYGVTCISIPLARFQGFTIQWLSRPLGKIQKIKFNFPISFRGNYAHLFSLLWK